MLDSSQCIVEAIVSFMEYQQWTRIAIITDLDDTYYLQMAEAFLRHIKKRTISVSFYLQAQNSIQLRGFDAKVVLVSASLNVSRQVIAKARENKWSWPTHAWMFHTHSLEDLFIDESCFCFSIV